jgi:competence protein ComEC
MTLLLLCFSFGIILAGYLPFLPPLMYFCLCLPALFFVKKLPLLIFPCAVAVGMFYGVLAGTFLLENQLSDEWSAQDIWVEGRVVDLPEANARRQSFTFNVERAFSFAAPERPINTFPSKIKLSSYDSLRVKTGEVWRLLVKLKKPRGFVNPGGFDYHVSLLRQGLGATGYCRSSALNRLLIPQPKMSMDVLRYQLQQWLLQKSQSSEKGILIALLVGDTSLVDKQHWGGLQKTGTTHLIAISGLHIGFFAIVGFFVGNFIGRFLQLLWHSCPSSLLGYLAAFVFAVFYSIVAGLNLPTLRTLIMLAVVQLVLLWRRNFRVRDTLLIAGVLVLLYDPLAAFDMGFWLSFGAVAVLIFSFSGRLRVQNAMPPHALLAKHFSLQRFFSLNTVTLSPLHEFLKSQWVMFVGLLIPLALLVHSSAILAPLANFVAIPLVTFFVVPCLMLAAIFHYFWAAGENFFLHFAEAGLTWLHVWLEYLLTLSNGKLNPLINVNPCALGLALLSVTCILMPRGLSNKPLGFCGLLLALLTPLKTLPALQMLVFDVGQGTAILLRTPHHQLIYDTGPAYTENFDAGSGIVAPYLQSQSISQLDAVIVSHNDADHSGGLAGLLAATHVEKLFLGEPEKYHASAALPAVNFCHQISPWVWDQVSFRFISWPINPLAKANNHSCVLLVEYQEQKILLTGDIEKEVENILVAQKSLTHVDVLLAPHHGSHTSSSAAFVAALTPKYVIYSAGYHNTFGHPHRDIQARYLSIAAQPINTAISGAIEFNWDEGGLQPLQEYRQFSKRYWFGGETQ